MSLSLVSLLLATAFPVLLQDKTPLVPPGIGPASDGYVAAVASDGTNFMVVSGSYAMLVDRDGKPLLPLSVVVPASRPIMPGSSNAPAVASSGNTYLVVAGGGEAALFDRSGTLQKIVDFGGPKTDYEVAPDVAWDGSRYIVLHADPANSERYVSTAISETGEVLGPNSEVAGNRVAARNGVVVIFSGADVIAGDDGFLTISLSRDHQMISGQHLDPSGTPDGSAFVIATGSISGIPRGSWTGRDYTVTFDDSGSPVLLHVTRAGLAGGPVKLENVQAYAPDIAWNGQSTLLTWGDLKGEFFLSTIHAGRVENDALATNFTVHRQDDVQTDGHLARTGVGIFAAWREFGWADGVTRSAAAATFVTAGGSGARIPLMDGWIQTAAGGPSSALVVQADDVNRLRPTIVTPGGAIPVPVVLAETFGPVAATWTGSAYLVTWTESRIGGGWAVYALHIGENGSVLDPEPLHIMDTISRDVAVGSNGRSALIVNSDPGGSALTAALVEGSVKQLDRLDEFSYHRDINVATDGSSYLVTWRSPSARGIAGRVVGANGELASEVRNYVQADPQNLFTFWTGENYLLVWSGYRDLWALRVAADGSPLDSEPHPIGILDAPLQDIVQFSPSQLAIITEDGTSLFGRRLVVRYAVAPRTRAVAH